MPAILAINENHIVFPPRIGMGVFIDNSASAAETVYIAVYVGSLAP